MQAQPLPVTTLAECMISKPVMLPICDNEAVTENCLSTSVSMVDSLRDDVITVPLTAREHDVSAQMHSIFDQEPAQVTWGHLMMSKDCDFNTCDKIFLVDGAGLNEISDETEHHSDKLLAMVHKHVQNL